jgi:branched-chain amino acid transport system permease protein
MTEAVRALVDVLSATSVLVLLVLGLGVVLSMMGVFNLAHGELVLVGALVMYGLGRAGVSPWWGLIVGPVAAGAAGAVIERSVVRPIVARPVAVLLATFALGAVAREVVRAALGGQTRPVAAPLSGTVALAGATFSQWRLFVVVAAIVVIAATVVALRRSRLGLWVRATLDNPELARVSGISTTAVSSATFAFGSALAGLAGALVVPLQGVNADLGFDYLVRAFLAVMVGGAGTFEGPVAGAVAIGVPSGGLPWLVQATYADVLVFAVAIVLMRWRPAGLWRGGTA